MKIAHRNAIHTIEATTDRVHGKFNTKAKELRFAIGDRVYLYQPAIQAGLTSKLTNKWIGPYRILHLRRVNARIKKYMAERSSCLNGRSQQVRGKADGKTRDLPAEEPTSSSHPREATITTEPPEDFGEPITATQETTGTPRTATCGTEAVTRAERTTLPDLERTATLVKEPTWTPDGTRGHTRSRGPSF
ncbi:hypothetical protein JTB14_020592 [Gonioctena quinquepunctata]|nr:hypothetical protein JTB14_020592 [Gonioctena quinquepunctata]